MLKLYKTSTCVYCVMVRKLLKTKNVPFIEVNVDDDFDTRLMLQKRAGALTVPILEKDDQFVVGYNPAKILQLIA